VSVQIRQVARGLAFSAFVLIVAVAIIESTLRIYFAVKVGPSVLLYGSSHSRDIRAFDAPQAEPSRTQEWRGTTHFRMHEATENSAWHTDTYTDGYMKYRPNQVRVDYDPVTQERFEVAINSHGFRGEDYREEKLPGVIRVVTLGSSSTFGYFDRDHETYPVQLEDLLNERCTSTYEVINLGIPHSRAKHILAILTHEGLKLDPDVVTFYEGVNDALASASPKKPGRLKASLEPLRTRLLLVAFMDKVLDLRGVSFNQATFERRTENMIGRFLEFMNAIRYWTRQEGIHLIIAAQQSKSATIASEFIRGTTYRDEVEIIRQRSLEVPVLSKLEISFLAHARLNDRLRDWTLENDLTYVDTVAALDARRDVLMSWVHLNAEGNRLIANALVEPILASTCKGRAARSRSSANHTN